MVLWYAYLDVVDVADHLVNAPKRYNFYNGVRFWYAADWLYILAYIWFYLWNYDARASFS